MEEYSAFIGLDVHAKTVSVCALAPGREGEELFAGTIANTPEALARLIGKMRKRGSKAQFCYEAGPCGYGIHRQIGAAGHDCIVVAPSLIPKKPGERIKTDKRDARKLARLLRAGELAAIWVPGPSHEAMRDLIRTRHAAMRLRVAAMQRLSSFLLRQGLYWKERRWTLKHRQWLAQQNFAEAAHRFVFKHQMDEIAAASAALKRIETEMIALLPHWPVAPLAEALRCLRGIDRIAAVTIAAAIGDPQRFGSARALMAFFGLVPSEHSTGTRRRQGAITKTGDSETRRILAEAAWCHLSPPRPSLAKQAILDKQPATIRLIAKACESRLNRRFRALLKANKPSQIAATAIAREQTGFIWAVSREVAVTP